MPHYLAQEDLGAIFGFLAQRYARAEEVPQYEHERQGFEKLCGVLERVQADLYYPTILAKAGYILIAINKGHFFSNGNKRLALVTMTTFLGINELQLKGAEKTWYRTFLGGLFPEYAQWEDFDEFTSTDFATYNLSIMIADSGVYKISHDELKARVERFLAETVVGGQAL